MKTNNFTRKHSIAIYFILTFVISWGIIILIAGPNNIPINSEKSKDILPLLYVSMLLGPSLAGILMIALIDGKKGFGILKSKFLKWRVKIWWYFLALFATPILAYCTLSILSLLSPQFQVGFLGSDNLISIVLNGIMVGLMVGIFEELGWTGFVIPRLNKSYNIFFTGLMVGIFWGAWHYILFWGKDTYSGVLPFVILFGQLFVWLPPFRIVMVWIYNSTKSLLLTILTHMSLVFTTTVIVPMNLTGKDLLIWIMSWGILLWIVVLILHRMKAFESPGRLKNEVK